MNKPACFVATVALIAGFGLTVLVAAGVVSAAERVTFVMNDGQVSREFHSFTLVRDAAGTGLLINTDSAVNG